MKADKGIQKLITIFIVFSFVLSSSILLIEELYFKQNLQKVALKNAIDKAIERETYIRNFLNKSEQNLHAISEHKYFKNFLNNTSQISNVEELFLIFAQSHPNYMQLRYLDKTGKEIIRIDRKALTKQPYLVNEKNLQDKSTRYYFSDSINKPLGKVWFSRIDLNREKGKVEIPYKSTLRAVLPLNINNEFGGILIINYFMKDFIAHLTSTPSFDMAVFDDKGYTISHFEHHIKDHSKCWGNSLDHKYNLKIDFPNDISKILNTPFLYEDTYVSRKLDLPIADGLNIVLQLKKSYLTELENRSRLNFLITAVIVFILSLILTYGVVKVFSQKLLNIEELNQQSDELKEKSQLLSEKNRELEESEHELTLINENLEEIIEEKAKDIKNREEILTKYVIYSRTDLKGIITDVSDAFCELSGYTREELIGNPHSIIRHPDISSETYKQLWSKIQKGESWQGELKNRAKDGSFYWVFSDISQEFDKNGNLLGYISIRSDITVKKEYELQMIQMLEQSKMAAMGEMIGNIAHQWRQPLTTISTKATGSLFQKDMGLLTDDVFEQNMESINENAQYLSQTIDIFRNFLKSNKEIVDLSIRREIENSIKIVEGALRNYDIKVNLDLCDDELTIHTTEGELSQVIINILNNSKDAILENRNQESFINVILYKEGNNAVISIEDNGGGIPDDILPKIFEPYFTTKHQSQGTGLGLQMCYKIVTQSLNGKIYVNNTQNGAKFFIELPVKEA